MTLAIKINTFQHVGNVALGGAAGGGGLLFWLDAHSAGLGVIAVFIVAITGIVFKVLAYRQMNRHNKEKEDILRANQSLAKK